MKTLMFWVMSVVLVANLGCGLSEEEMKKKFVANEVYNLDKAAKESDVQEFAQARTKADRLLQKNQADLQAQIKTLRGDLQGQINDLKGAMESSNGTLTTLQTSVDKCLADGRDFAGKLGAQEGQNGKFHEALQLQSKSMKELFAKLQTEFDNRVKNQNVEQLHKDTEEMQRQLRAMKDLVEGVRKDVNNRPNSTVVNKLLDDVCTAQKSLANVGKQIENIGKTNNCVLNEIRQLKEADEQLRGADRIVVGSVAAVSRRLDNVAAVADAAAPRSALEQLQTEVRQLSTRQDGTVSSLEQARQAAARADEQLRKEKLNRFACHHPWVGDDLYQVDDRHQSSGARSGPAAIFQQKKDGSVVAEVYEWSSYNGRPYATGKKVLRTVVRQGDGTRVYDGYDAGGWPCKHFIRADELFPELKLSLFDSPARRS